jgi:HEAT repeat protein
MRVGIVNALGNRQTPGAIPSLKKLVPGEDPEAAVAAVTALGKIADDASVQVLRKIFDSAQEPLRSYTAEALLRCADRRLEAGRMEEAADLYRIFTGGKEPDPLRTAATIGLLRSAQDRSGLMVPILKGDDDAAKSAAISLIPEFSELDVAPVASEMPKLSNNHKIQMLSALAELGKRAAMPVILEMSLHEDPEVRLSALKAIGVLGDENSVRMLAERAAGSQGVEKEAARRSLASIPVQEADSLILAEIPKAGIPLKVELIRSIETRRMRSATPVLIACLSDTDKKVRMESYRSLSETADPEFLSALMEALISVEDEGERREASKALAMTGSRMDTGRRTALLLERYPSVKNPQARAPMLEVLGKWGDDSGLPLLKSELGSKHAEIRTSAVRALSDWPNGAPMPELLSTVKTSRDDVNRILALRGYIRLAGTGERPCAQAMQDYRTALGLASEANEKRQVLSGIARLSCEEAASMAFECMNNPELEAEAGAAVIQISLNLVETDFTGAAKLLERLERETRDEETKHRAAEILERMKE